MINLVFPFPPLSVNELYSHVNGKKILNRRVYNPYRDNIHVILWQKRRAIMKFSKGVLEKETPLKFNYTFFKKNFYTKKGTMNKRAGDIDNGIKASQDIVTSFMGIDDYLIVDTTLKKRPSEKTYFTILIEASPWKKKKKEDV